MMGANIVPASCATAADGGNRAKAKARPKRRVMMGRFYLAVRVYLPVPSPLGASVTSRSSVPVSVLSAASDPENVHSFVRVPPPSVGFEVRAVNTTRLVVPVTALDGNPVPSTLPIVLAVLTGQALLTEATTVFTLPTIVPVTVPSPATVSRTIVVPLSVVSTRVHPPKLNVSEPVTVPLSVRFLDAGVVGVDEDGGVEDDDVLEPFPCDTATPTPAAAPPP